MGQMRNAEIQAWELLAGGEQVRRLREMFDQSPSFSALLQGPEHRFVLTNPAYQRLIGHRDVIGLTVREAVPEVERQGFIDLLDSVFATGEAFVGKDVEVVLRRSAATPRRRVISILSSSPSKTRRATSPQSSSKGSTSPTDTIRRRRFGPPRPACAN